MKKITEIILGYLLLISGIFIVTYIFKFENYWLDVILVLFVFSFIVYIRWDKKHEKAFLNAMNKSRKRKQSRK